MNLSQSFLFSKKNPQITLFLSYHIPFHIANICIVFAYFYIVYEFLSFGYTNHEVIFVNSRHDQEYKKLGLNIAYYRKLNGISQMQLAEAVGISRTHMSNIEAPNMPTSISLETLMDIADALGVPVNRLLTFPQ